MPTQEASKLGNPGDATPPEPTPLQAGARIAIEAVEPEIECGRFAAKAVAGDDLEISADIFCDGTAVLGAALLYRAEGTTAWQTAPMSHWDNDRWRGTIPIPASAIGGMRFTIEAWMDGYATWRRDYQKKAAAGADVHLDLIEGGLLLKATLPHVTGSDRDQLQATLRGLDAGDSDRLLSADTQAIMTRCQERRHLSRYAHDVPVWIDRSKARYSTWYELFPRSQSGVPGRHGTFDDVIRRLPDIADLGFDVLYFPPIHPIGLTNRKGPNNNPKSKPGDPGSPYATGSAEGGHTAIHPELGTIEDFRRLVAAARERGLELALDFAIQCSPDHPWLKEHRDWFAWRPDGSLRYAENPPKKYEDIVNVEFYGKACPGSWQALRDVILFWIEQGVKIFRVDNPHTKPFPFWEWLITTIRERHPDAIFLSEAFTRPKVMKRLAKLGFTQSYTYFTWRETKQELTEYLTELSTAPVKHFFRPNFFANTPDINPKHLQAGGRPVFLIRAALAATLSSTYGIYSGFELCEATPIPGSEEYLHSEKYEIKTWDWNRPGNIRAYIKTLNRIRRENPALQDFAGLRFYNAFDGNILYFAKMTAKKDNVVLIAVNLDPHHAHACDFEIPLWEFGLPDDADMDAEDLLTGQRITWHGKIQHLHLDPADNPCAIWRLLR